MKNHIPVLVVGKLSWKSIGIFNPNAFPPELRNTAMNCGDQLALIENSLSNTTKLIENQKNEFLKILQNDQSFKDFTPEPQKPAKAFYHNLAFLTDFISLKQRGQVLFFELLRIFSLPKAELLTNRRLRKHISNELGSDQINYLILLYKGSAKSRFQALESTF